MILSSKSRNKRLQHYDWWKNFFWSASQKWRDNICKIATGHGYDYITVCLLGYNFFKRYYKMIAIDISEQQARDADPKEIQQVNFTGNLERDDSVIMFLIIEEAKETALDFSRRNC